MSEIRQGVNCMHYITSEQYTYLAGEINALYHEAAVKMGISDSVQNILYVLCDQGSRCSQSEIGRLTGISRQTINSAIRKLERDGIVYLEQGQGRNTIVCLTNKGKAFAAQRVVPLLEAEQKIRNEWTPEEQREYLRLTQKYRDGLKRHLQTMLT